MTGIPACVVVTPLVYSFALLVAYIINAIVPLHPSTRTSLQTLARRSCARSKRSTTAAPQRPSCGSRSAFRSWWCLAPTPFVTWLVVRGLLGQVGVGWSLDRIGARPLRPATSRSQLGNLVEEIAIAAGVKPPTVLIDTPRRTRRSPAHVDDSTILATRGLLDTLDRRDAAVIAHLVGSVGNGDLRIGSIIFSIYQTWARSPSRSTHPSSDARARRWARVQVASDRSG